MAIKVRLTDGTVQAGGEFNDTLNRIKSLRGRKWDGATKTWIVPMTIRQFSDATALPITTPDRHITRYGNSYTTEEWESCQAAFREEAEETQRQLDAMKEILHEAAQKLVDIGISGDTYTIAHRIFYQGFENIQFSSEERRRQVTEIADWINEQSRTIW